jgi:hypothetical protein|nr:hypothetical protein [uncultured Emticicia sp.]
MEVHHHSHHPKKWKEYISEFLMLFAAVTLGFFAENLREHQIEKHREIQFLKNIHLDLERDIKEIDNVMSFNINKQQYGEELAKLYETGVSKDLPKFYFLVKTLALRTFFQHSKNGLEQLKNAGGLRLVEDEEIIQQLQLIEIRVANTESLQESMDLNLTYFRMKTNAILDAVTVQEMNMNQKLKNTKTFNFRRFEVPSSARPLHLKSTDDINELVNLGIAPVNTTKYINGQLVELRKECLQLNKLLIQKYGEEF